MSLKNVFKSKSVIRSISSLNYKNMSKSGRKPQNYDNFLVLDFEATCDRPKQLDPMEIIEFPVIQLNSNNFQTEDIFHRYVKPKYFPNLTNFCTQLTGIIDEMVDNEQHFDIVLNDFNKWLNTNGLLSDDFQRCVKRFTFVTCGEWDLQLMFPNQCQLLNLRIPRHFRQWINIKKSFANHFNCWPKSLSFMLEHLNIEPIGRLHSGIDDCHNIVLIMKAMADRGVIFKNTSSEW